MTTNPNFPPKTPPDEPSSDSDDFDPERFGEVRVPTTFLREALSAPLPHADEDDLLQDTIPPAARLTGDAVTQAALEDASTIPTKTPFGWLLLGAVVSIGTLLLLFLVPGEESTASEVAAASTPSKTEAAPPTVAPAPVAPAPETATPAEEAAEPSPLGAKPVAAPPAAASPQPTPAQTTKTAASPKPAQPVELAPAAAAEPEKKTSRPRFGIK